MAKRWVNPGVLIQGYMEGNCKVHTDQLLDLCSIFVLGKVENRTALKMKSGQVCITLK